MKKVLLAALIAALFSYSAGAAENCCGNGPKTNLRRETNTQSLPPAPPVAEADNEGSAFTTDLPDRTTSRRRVLRAQAQDDNTHGWTAPSACCNRCCNNDSLVMSIERELSRPFLSLEERLVELEGKRLRRAACELNTEACELSTEADGIATVQATGAAVGCRQCFLDRRVKTHEAAQAKLACEYQKWSERAEKLQQRKATLNRCCE